MEGDYGRCRKKDVMELSVFGWCNSAELSAPAGAISERQSPTSRSSNIGVARTNRIKSSRYWRRANRGCLISGFKPTLVHGEPYSIKQHVLVYGLEKISDRALAQAFLAHTGRVERCDQHDGKILYHRSTGTGCTLSSTRGRW